jgi:hypothetical protein
VGNSNRLCVRYWNVVCVLFERVLFKRFTRLVLLVGYSRDWCSRVLVTECQVWLLGAFGLLVC